MLENVFQLVMIIQSFMAFIIGVLAHINLSLMGQVLVW